jgi:hypothetical protein
MEKEKDLKTCLNRSAYLFGNGINRTSIPNEDRYKWSSLLEDLNDSFANNAVLNLITKPFPMVYDEIVNYSLRNANKSESYVKSFIKNTINKIEPNDRYKGLKKLNKIEILTTNYDYLIENAIEDNWRRGSINKLEYKYSIYRFQKTAKSKVWHIHGEQADSRSILLGFKHYMDYVSKVKQRAELYISGLKTNTEHNNPSWVELFFTHNINIIGLGMSFTEYPLWWLLAYRNQIILSNSNLDVNNNINFFIPSFKKVENADLIDMLQSYGVNCTVIDVLDNDYDNFYEKALTSI